MKVKTINREISWLSFNQRVLQEAADPVVPLIERLRFLGIFSNNLDEFFRVRVASLRRLLDLEQQDSHTLDFSPQEVLKQIRKIDRQCQKRFNQIYSDILTQLEQENIFLINEKQLDKQQGEFVARYFRDQVQPHLFPVMIKSFKRSSFLQDRAIYLAVYMQRKIGDVKPDYALVRIPSNIIPRFLILPSRDNKNFILMLDDVIRHNLGEIFPVYHYDVYQAYSISLTRDAELDIDPDISRSFMERIRESLKQRKKGKPVRFVYDRQMPAHMLELLVARLKVTEKQNIIPGERYQNFSDYMHFPNLGGPHLEYKPLPALPHRELESNRSMFSVLREKDILMHFPYQSFHYIVDWLREASIDPRVKSVKMTLYRVAKDSGVINALINAARNGKSVTVFLELQARFDEMANIRWSQILQEEGVKVIHGTAGLKVHSKLILIRRKEDKKNVLYANIGTGNFHEETARLYADESLLTNNPVITREVEKVFDLFEKPMLSLVNFRHLVVSPFHTRKVMLRLISREIRHAREGKPAEIFLKLNSLMDQALVKKLYQASSAGVKCRLIVRGICVLIPGIPGISENIQVISIVDRFLEHSRIFVFHNLGQQQVYLSSADLMIRNLDRRIEVGCPVLDPGLKQELLDMLEIQWADNQKARLLDENQLNQHVARPDEPPVRSQMAFYDYLKKRNS